MRLRNRLEEPLARHSRKQKAGTRSHSGGTPARLTPKRLERAAAEVFGQDYAVAPDKSVWVSLGSSRGVFMVDNDCLRLVVQWAPRAPSALEGVMGVVVNTWNRRLGVPAASVVVDEDVLLQLSGVLSVPLGGGVTDAQLVFHLRDAVDSSREMFDYLENVLPESRFDEIAKRVGIDLYGETSPDAVIATAKRYMAQAEGLMYADSDKAAELIGRAGECVTRAGLDPEEVGIDAGLARVLNKQLRDRGTSREELAGELERLLRRDRDGAAFENKLLRDSHESRNRPENRRTRMAQRVAALLEGLGVQPAADPEDNERLVARLDGSTLTISTTDQRLDVVCRFDDLTVPAPDDDQTSTALVVARAWNQGFSALAVRVTGAGPADGRYRGEPGAGLGTGADAPLGVEGYACWLERPGMTDRQLTALLEAVLTEAPKLSTFWRENVADAEDEREFLRRQG